MKNIILSLIAGCGVLGAFAPTELEALKVNVEPSIAFRHSHEWSRPCCTVYRQAYPVTEIVEKRWIDPCTGHVMIEQIPVTRMEIVEHAVPCHSRSFGTDYKLKFKFK